MMYLLMSADTTALDLDLFKWLVGAILGSGSVAAWLTYRIQKKKAPAEVNNIAVQGAETAVLAMQKVYDAEVAAHERTRKDRDRLQAEVDEQRDEIKALLAEIDVLKTAIAALQRRAIAVASKAGVTTDPYGLATVGPGHPRS